jgi:hypothetical protein
MRHPIPTADPIAADAALLVGSLQWIIHAYLAAGPPIVSVVAGDAAAHAAAAAAHLAAACEALAEVERLAHDA